MSSKVKIDVLPPGAIGRPEKAELLSLIQVAQEGLPETLRDPNMASAYVDKILTHATLVTSYGGIIALYANNKESRRAFITLVSIYPEARRQGFAISLLTTAIDYLRKINFKLVELDVITGNVGAIALYERLGFQPSRYTLENVRMEAKL